MTQPPALSREQIHRRLYQIIVHPPEKREISVAELARRLGIHESTLRIWARTTYPERYKPRIESVFANLDSGRQPFTRFPGASSKVRKLICYRALRILMAADCGNLGATIINAYRDPLLILLKTTYKKPTDQNWEKVCDRVRLALVARYGTQLRAKGVKFNLGAGNFWNLMQRMQIAGILPADVDMTPQPRKPRNG